MDEITLELMKMILGSLSNFILLLVGAGLARYTVSYYQRSKDSTLVRENLLNLYSEALCLVLEFSGFHSEWSDILKEKKENPKHEYFLRSFEIRRDLITTLGKLYGTITILMGRIKIQIKLTIDESKSSLIFLKSFKNFHEMLINIIEEEKIKDEIEKEREEEIEQLIETFSTNLSNIFGIIINGKISI